MTLATFLVCVSLFGAALSWIMVALIFLRLRHCGKLDQLLFSLVLDAWRNQHLPIWTAWSAMSGRRFIINMVERERSKHSGQ